MTVTSSSHMVCAFNDVGHQQIKEAHVLKHSPKLFLNSKKNRTHCPKLFFSSEKTLVKQKIKFSFYKFS